MEKVKILEELTEDAVVDTVNKYRQGILHEETPKLNRSIKKYFRKGSRTSKDLDSGTIDWLNNKVGLYNESHETSQPSD
ncbi:unnamed protein product [Rhizophagus irregularis]|nr:unnamed protein product [Rhizophagus irregularis]CAB5209369.1 unnamed protein product [Rhizophagus irregularis]